MSISKTFNFKLKLKGTTKDFGLGEGILISQDITVTVKDGDYSGIPAALIRLRDEFIEEHLEVVIGKLK